MNDPYYNPEKFGLTKIAEMEWSEPCYSFDMTVAWLDANGKLYWGSDSGCSCPSPFESTGLDSLDTGSFFDLDKEINERLGNDNEYYSGGSFARNNAVEFLGRVRTATLAASQNRDS